ncbi:START domain-containing protein [Endozoicomonas sp. GU-1]|uniref:START domain-containing protein n=1 Tax=Endozoicomonas sp. GU-1 TaxID=3009078 RepID=UPI0022B3C456|nr:START domain-containing protein [Endozoicomonas sp. GU-1]WBA80497.1 START domain-containing protein [Endozoicomonas sp. GU-1]WBA88061.1 START domain-containing protein [Endozoicomonas sp. GU-1]
MKHLITCGISLLLAWISLALAEEKSEHFEWQLVKDDSDSGIKVFTRNVAGSELREFRGEMTISSTLTAPVALIEDVAVATEWMHNCGGIDALEYHQDRGEAITYMITKAPWPVSDRDTVVHSRTRQDATSKVVRVDLTAKNDQVPANNDYVRITRMNGFWLFTPAADGQIDVVYQVHAEPGGALPAWLSNSIVVDTPYHTLKNMQMIIQAGRYQKAQRNYIQNDV